MKIFDSYIPYGAYWSTPFARWQGAFSNLHALRFAAHVARQELASKSISPESLDMGVLGTTVVQKHCFFGLPWLGALIGAEHLAGPTINQACATSARCIMTAAQELECAGAESVLIVTADRTSNGPHIYYPQPQGPGGTGDYEDWVLDNFRYDPYGGTDMLCTAENVAAKWDISTEEQHDLVLARYEQYQDALRDDNAFQRRYMTLPFDVPNTRFNKTVNTIAGDEGVYPCHRDRLEQLTPVQEEGTVTHAGQTHPADGNAGMIVTTRDKVKDYSGQPGISIRVIASGQSRAEKSFMPYAPVLAAQKALATADLKIAEMKVIKSHNPFAVNDIVFARETNADLKMMNNLGCSLIYGHPQGPTGLRACIELIEELVQQGGGYGMFQGCAAGDSAVALIFNVEDV